MRRLSPLPSWDLALVLRALKTAHFEPLQSVELKFLSMKALLLTALASLKMVGDLQAFLVDQSFFEIGPADSSVTLRSESWLAASLTPNSPESSLTS